MLEFAVGTGRVALPLASRGLDVSGIDGTFAEFTAPFRYVWPSELDLMARIAGLTLEHRWAGWDRAPFTGDSALHVSVWRRPPAGDP